MASVLIVTVLETAGEVYIKELASSVGEGIVETLFNQKAIADDLNEIKLQLAALSEFIRNRLPVLIERSVDLAFARKAEFDVAEKARTIVGSIATLQRALEAGVPATNIQFLISELAGHADSIFELGGALISYGQPYYASVAVAFGMGVKAFTLIVSVAPERVESLYQRMEDWKAKLFPWVDDSRPTSLTATLNGMEERFLLGQKTVPSFETWNTQTTREVLISWQQQGDTIWLAGAWFGYWKETGLNGNLLARPLAPGESVEQAQAAGTLRYTWPEWWTVKPNSIPSRADYEQCANSLSILIHDYYAYPVSAPTLKNAVSIVKNMIEVIDIVSKRPEAETTKAPLLGTLVVESAPTPEQQAERIAQAMMPGRLGIGMTWKF